MKRQDTDVMISGVIQNLLPRSRSVKVSVTPEPASGDGHEALLRKVQAGDRAALGLLLTPHEARLMGLCVSILGSIDEAEDAVQETFLRALRALGRPGGFRGDCAFSTWLFRIAVRVCLDSRQERAPVESRDAAHLEAVVDSAPTPEAAVVDRISVARALAELQPRQRTLIVLREQEGWSTSEIAVAFGWNEKRVQNELYKTRQRLLRLRQDGVTGGGA